MTFKIDASIDLDEAQREYIDEQIRNLNEMLGINPTQLTLPQEAPVKSEFKITEADVGRKVEMTDGTIARVYARMNTHGGELFAIEPARHLPFVWVFSDGAEDSTGQQAVTCFADEAEAQTTTHGNNTFYAPRPGIGWDLGAGVQPPVFPMWSWEQQADLEAQFGGHNCAYHGHEYVETGMKVSWCKHCDSERTWDHQKMCWSDQT